MIQLLDTFIVQHLNAWISASRILTDLGIFLASYLQYVLAALLFYFAIRSRAQLKENISASALAVFAAVTARLAVKPAVVHFFHRARPDILLTNIHRLIPPDIADNYRSFPSGHAIFFFALATVIYHYNKKWGYFFFASALIMGIARVAVGVHWPTDILGGIVLGFLTAKVCIAVFKKYIF
jgi:undecaprenyl-diphosphatase